MGFSSHGRARYFDRNGRGKFVFVGGFPAFFPDGGTEVWRKGGSSGAGALAGVSGIVVLPVYLYGVAFFAFADPFLFRPGAGASSAGAGDGFLAAADTGGGHFLRVSAFVAYVFQVAASVVGGTGQSKDLGWKDRTVCRAACRRFAGIEFRTVEGGGRGVVGSGSIDGMGRLLSAHAKMDGQCLRGD